jgi:hypothetical protein
MAVMKSGPVSSSHFADWLCSAKQISAENKRTISETTRLRLVCIEASHFSNRILEPEIIALHRGFECLCAHWPMDELKAWPIPSTWKSNGLAKGCINRQIGLMSPSWSKLPRRSSASNKISD